MRLAPKKRSLIEATRATIDIRPSPNGEIVESFRESEHPILLGYVGDGDSVPDDVDALFADGTHYSVKGISVDGLPDAAGQFGGLLLDSAAVDDAGDDLQWALEIDRPLVVVDPDEPVTLPGRLVPHVDADDDGAVSPPYSGPFCRSVEGGGLAPMNS